MVAAPTLRTGEIRPAQQTPTIVPVKLQVSRELAHPPGQVFRAYADVGERAHWYPLPDETVDFETTDFRTGGSDRFRCGRTDHETFVASTDYRHIVDDQCIVFVEQLSNAEGQLLSISLVTWTMAPSGSGTVLAINDQTTSIVGSSPIESSRYNYERMLDRLANHLTDG